MLPHRLPLLTAAFVMIWSTITWADTERSPQPEFKLQDIVLTMLDAEQSALRSVSYAPLASISPKPRGKMKRASAPKSRPLNYSRKYLDSLPVASGGPEWECLTEALYFEARGESVQGLFAVAEVIMNRVDSKRFPNTLCKVINQGTGRKFACQFTYTCDGRAEVIAEKRAYQRMGKVAKLMMNGAPRSLTSGATYYHTTAVNPRWAKTFRRTAKIGVHLFYKPHRKVAKR